MRVPMGFNLRNAKTMVKTNFYARAGKKKILDTGTEEIIKSHGYEVVDIKDVLFPPPVKEQRINIVGFQDPEIPLDENHPNYKVTPCYKFEDWNVLLEGLDQAKVLTNTVEIGEVPDILGEYEKKIKLSEEFHSEFKKRIMLSCVFEATQKILPKKKDPERPAWNFRREYGIDCFKKNELMCKNILTLCEQLAKNPMEKSAVTDAFFAVPLQAHNKNILLELKSELAVTSGLKIKPLADPSATKNVALPNLHPIDCTVSLNPVNFYEMESIYPIKIKSRWPYVHLAFVHYNNTEVRNLYAEPITETQIFGRTLMKGFSIAASQAVTLFGKDVRELPEPIVVPLVHTDGQKFYFGIYQLNTLEIDKNSETKNLFWNCPIIYLYEACEYKSGRPILEGYNPNVIEKVISMYNMQ